ncbi:hypothetical protein ACFMPD_12930, partial [Sedimentitalea sp. HM32M-2]|uniref:hypothetical protein n=1 Tax=Sedimentitalea sp. HM32M-2 TaxID=3351566 RepID=UPI00364097A8
MMQSARLENNGEIPRREVIARSTDGIRKRREQVDRQRPAALPRPSPQRLSRGCTGTEHRQSSPLAYA